MQCTDKQLVKKRFSKHFDTYHRKAIVQQRIATRLADLVSEINNNSLNKVLEFGCGTGFLTARILEKSTVEQYYLNDLTDVAYEENEAFKSAENKHKFTCIPGDAERIDFPNNLDVVLSSSTVQWFSQLELFFEKVNKVLKPEGLFAFSTFGPDNFKELKQVCNVGLPYKTTQEILAMLPSSFDVVYKQEWKESIVFSNPIEVLRHMKLTGVTGVSSSFFGKEKLLAFNKTYQDLFSNKDLSVNLTYNPIIIIAKKK